MSLHILEESPNTDDAFGGLPEDRSLEERLASGFILIDKPAGPTSHQLAAWREIFSVLSVLVTVGPSIRLQPVCSRSWPDAA